MIRAYAFNRAWGIGFLMDISGAMLMLRALSLAHVTKYAVLAVLSQGLLLMNNSINVNGRRGEEGIIQS